MKKKDIIIVCVIMLLYSLLSFWRLGSFKEPNTFTETRELNFKLDTKQQITKVVFFTGHEVKQVQISLLMGEEEFLLPMPTDIYVFNWYEIGVNAEIDGLKIELAEETSLGEIAVLNQEENIIDLIPLETEGKLLQDEQHLVPEEITYYHNAYFDEIYFARTAYEYANDLPAYEWTHPPLAKLLMAIPVKLFGMAPFYYRLMGNIAGILMIFVIYIFANKMFKNTKYSVLAALMMTLDNFHFAQTRMGTTDSFLVLFIMLSYYFMYCYITLPKEATNKKRYIMLLFTGIFIGCAISTKWTGLFAGMGLAIIFLVYFLYDFIWAKQRKEQFKTILICFLTCIIIPILIYISCYLFFPNIQYFPTEDLAGIITITKEMYRLSFPISRATSLLLCLVYMATYAKTSMVCCNIFCRRTIYNFWNRKSCYLVDRYHKFSIFNHTSI